MFRICNDNTDFSYGLTLTALSWFRQNTADYNQWIFYFNYESSACGSGSAPQNQTVTGASMVANSNDGGGDSGSDFLLVELNSTIPLAYNTYYNGWNRLNSSSSSGVSIHHPSGDRKIPILLLSVLHNGVAAVGVIGEFIGLLLATAMALLKGIFRISIFDANGRVKGP